MSTGAIERGAKRHRRHRLNAAEQVDLIGTAQRHRGDRRGRRLAIQRRRAGDHPLHAGNLRRHHAHVRAGHHRIAAAGNVTTDAGDRDVLVAEPHAGQRFHLHVAQGGMLHFGKMADLRLGELDVVDDLRRQGADQRIDLRT